MRIFTPPVQMDYPIFSTFLDGGATVNNSNNSGWSTSSTKSIEATIVVKRERKEFPRG